MKSLYSFAALSILASSLGFAQDSVKQNAAFSPTQNNLSYAQSLMDDGYARVSDGLFVDQNSASPAYVAINENGRKTLLVEVNKDRANYLRHAQKNGIQTQEQNFLNSLDRVIADLSKQATVAKGSMTQTGTCLVPNGATLRAMASSYGGTSASANAVNYIDFGPATPTTNVAQADTDYASLYNTAVGTTAASVSTSNAQSCFAESYGSVTCPGESSPGVAAYAYSFNRAARCNY
jgi:hypothetical protein